MGKHLFSWACRKNGHDQPKGADRLMYLILAEKAYDEDAFAWPSVETLRLECNLADRTSVERTIARLIAGGWVANDERYVARKGRPVDGTKRGYRIVVPENEWAQLAAIKAAPKRQRDRPEAESRSEAALPKNAAPTQGNAAPEPKECRSDAQPLRKEPYRTGTEPNPPYPPDGGSATPIAGCDAITQRLWREAGIQLSTKNRRAIKHRLRAGESLQAVYASFAPKPRWEPPPADAPAQAVWSRIRDRIKAHPTIHQGTFTTWFVPVDAVRADTCPGRFRFRLTLAAPSPEFATWLERNYGEFIRNMAQEENTEVLFWRPEGSQ